MMMMMMMMMIITSQNVLTFSYAVVSCTIVACNFCAIIAQLLDVVLCAIFACSMLHLLRVRVGSGPHYFWVYD